MAFIDFINEYVDDDDFKTTVNSLYDVWMKSGERSRFESADSAQQTADGQQEPTQAEPRPIQGDMNNIDSQKIMSLANRFQEIEKQKADNQKAADEAQEKVDAELDDLQNNLNAAINGKA